MYIGDLPPCSGAPVPPPARPLSAGVPLPSQATARAHLVPLPPNLTPQAHGHDVMLASIYWVTERNKTGTASEELAAENSCQINREKLKKSTLLLDKGCHCTQGRKLQAAPCCCGTLDSRPSGQERQTHRKRFFHNAPLVCQISRLCQK